MQHKTVYKREQLGQGSGDKINGGLDRIPVTVLKTRFGGFYFFAETGIFLAL